MKIDKFEELVKKVKAKALKEEAKKEGMTAVCGKKIDIGKQLPTVSSIGRT